MTYKKLPSVSDAIYTGQQVYAISTGLIIVRD